IHTLPLPPRNQVFDENGYTELLDRFFPPLPAVNFLVPAANVSPRVDVASTVFPIARLHGGQRGADQVHIAVGTDRFGLPREYFETASEPVGVPGPDGFPSIVRVTVPGRSIVERLQSLQPMDVDYGEVRLTGVRVSPEG